MDMVDLPQAMAPRSPTADESHVAAMACALEATALRLHGIASRTAPAQIAAEVLRLNDAVRAATGGRLQSGDHPQDFAATLLAHADPVNTGSGR